jgi:lysophospholipase L1-like esterase
MVLFNFLVSNVLYRYFKNTLQQSLLLITGNLVLSILLSLVLLFDYCCISKRYFPIIKTRTLIDIEKKYWLNSDTQSIVGKIKDRYLNSGLTNNIRVLFIGTSQTWGAGARDEIETFVNRIEKELNSSIVFNGRFECINAGIMGSDSAKLFDLYMKEWLVLKPKIVVIILSNNDTDAVQFSNVLKHFADLNVSNGIKTMFVLEANSIESTSDGLKMHKFMKQVGQEKNVQVLDLHNYLAQNYEKGFLWWDPVHLTSFGQKLAADFLFNEIFHQIRSFALNDKTNINFESMQ